MKITKNTLYTYAMTDSEHVSITETMRLVKNGENMDQTDYDTATQFLSVVPKQETTYSLDISEEELQMIKTGAPQVIQKQVPISNKTLEAYKTLLNELNARL